MKTIAKILVAIAILNAAGRGGMAAWAYYQFKDGTERLLLFDTGTPLEGLREQIFESAETLACRWSQKTFLSSARGRGRRRGSHTPTRSSSFRATCIP